MSYLSIIVPVYKVEKYIHQCIESILNQSFTDYELILVDDGSPDYCPQICDEYAKSYSYVKVIHKENGGLTSAWLEGLKNISTNTEYITFVDSDDYISENYLTQFIDKVKRYNPDVVIGNTIKFYNDNKKFTVQHKNGYYDKARLREELYPTILFDGNFHGRGYQVSRWGKFFKKNLLLENIKYCNKGTSYSEDLNITFPIMLDAESVYFLNQNEGVYYYRMNPESMLHSYDKTMLDSILHVFPSLVQVCIDKKHEELIPQVYADFLAASVQYFKNELQNPEGFNTCVENITQYSKNIMLIQAIDNIEWKHFRKLNVIIIRCLNNYNWFNINIITRFLSILKRSGIRKPS